MDLRDSDPNRRTGYRYIVATCTGAPNTNTEPPEACYTLLVTPQYQWLESARDVQLIDTVGIEGSLAAVGLPC